MGTEKRRAGKRELSIRFMDNLESGFLRPFLERVHADSTLLLSIRSDAIDIYYRGGKLLRLKQTPKGYRADWERQYAKKLETGSSAEIPKFPQTLEEYKQVEELVKAFPLLKQAMDTYIKPNTEKDVQQNIAKYNNISRGTDYFICDIEYVHYFGKKKARADLIGINWPSDGESRKKCSGWPLAWMELKVCDKAIRTRPSSTGLKSHLQDFLEFVSDSRQLEEVKLEMAKVFNQQKKLELIHGCKKNLQKIGEKIQYIILLADHDPESSILGDEFKEIQELLQENAPPEHVKVRVARANFLGYGLHSEGLVDIDTLIKNHENQIYQGR